MIFRYESSSDISIFTQFYFLKKRPWQVKCSFSTCNVRCGFFSPFFSPPPLLLSLSHFFFPGRKTAGHPRAAWSLEQILEHPGHRGGQAALPWHSCPDDPEADGHHPAIRVTMPITGVGGGYQMVPPGSREELPEGPGSLPQESCK